ncbi:MAG: hypothetical protein ACOYOE_06085 [Chlorobium sp.]
MRKESVCLPDYVMVSPSAPLRLSFGNGVSGSDRPISSRFFPIRVRKKFGLDYLVSQHSAPHIRFWGGQCFQLPTQNLEKRIYQEKQENRLQELVEKQ